MRTRLLFIFSLLFGALSMSAQHFVTAGTRMGGAFYLGGDNMKAKPGIMHSLDVRYMYGWDLTKATDLNLGLETGLAISHSVTGRSGSFHDTYSVSDYLGHPIAYDISAYELYQSMSLCQIEIPVMASLRVRGWHAAAGLKMMALATGRVRQELLKLSISGTYTEYATTITDEPIIAGDYIRKAWIIEKYLHDMPPMHLLFSIEGGKEFMIRQGQNGIGIGVFADMGLLSSASKVQAAVPNATTAEEAVVSIIPGSSYADPLPTQKHQLLSNSIGTRYHYMAFGLSIYYVFHKN